MLFLFSECVRLNPFYFGFIFHSFNPGFWIVSESEEDISELKSYESGEYESEEVDSDEIEEEEGIEIEGEEEGDEIEESDNDIEVMEILAEAQKQSHIEKRPEQTKIDRNEKTETISANNSNTVSNVNVDDRPEAKVCIHNLKVVREREEFYRLLKAFNFDLPRVMSRYHHQAMVAFPT